ncbi:MAG TPA: helix-turn-helix transcriptional regulator [Steroidobacteraceae bacterium]|nr:helix-turn-helix transcriptional regulator [Steroidobacteraceae bacterium]
MSAPGGLAGGGALRLGAGEFFGSARLSCSAPGIRVTHHLAAGAPDAVVTHTHADLHFILVSGGEYVSAAGPPPAAGPVLVYNPVGTTHRDHFEWGRGSFFTISLAAQYLQQTLPERLPAAPPAYLVQPVQHTLARSIAACCARELDPLALEALCVELLGTLARAAEPAARPAPPWLGRALELLHDRYEAALTMADISRAVGVHPIHLARTFRRHFHCTPAAFAQYRRLEKAAGLLARTGAPLADIAQACGFGDQAHLTRLFTRSFGLPPGLYRGLAGGRFQIDKTPPALWGRVSAAAAQARAQAGGRR